MSDPLLDPMNTNAPAQAPGLGPAFQEGGTTNLPPADMFPPKRPTLSETYGAGVMQESEVAAAIERLTHAQQFKPDPEHDPWESIKGTKYEDYWPSFVTSQSSQQTESITAQIDREMQRRQILSESHWFHGLAASTAGALLSPTTLIGAGVGVTGVRLARMGRTMVTARSAAVGAGVAGGTAAIQEVALQGLQETRTMQETLFSVGGATVLGGVLGGAIGAYQARQIANLARKIDVDQRIPVDVSRDPFGPNELEATARILDGEDPHLPPNRSGADASAARVDQGDVKVSGLEWLTETRFGRLMTSDLTPVGRTLMSELRAVRQAANRLVQNPLQTAQNAEFRPNSARAPVETNINLQQAKIYNAMKALQENFAMHRFGKPKVFAGALRSEMNREPGKLPWKEFKQEVSKSIRAGHSHDIPEVVAAGKAYSKLFDDLFDEAKALGMYGPEVKKLPGYLTRVYDVQEIVRNYADFKALLVDWLKKGQAAAEKELQQLYRQIDELERGQQTARPAGLDRQVDAELEAIRQTPEFKDVMALYEAVRGMPKKRPQTLVEWVRERGGLRDDLGELAAMIGKRSGEFINNKSGMLLDDATRAAWEDGFFTSAERPEINDFLELLRRDYGGDPVVRAQDYESLDSFAIAEQLRRELRDDWGLHDGLSPATAEKRVADTMLRDRQAAARDMPDDATTRAQLELKDIEDEISVLKEKIPDAPDAMRADLERQLSDAETRARMLARELADINRLAIRGSGELLDDVEAYTQMRAAIAKGETWDVPLDTFDIGRTALMESEHIVPNNAAAVIARIEPDGDLVRVIGRTIGGRQVVSSVPLDFLSKSRAFFDPRAKYIFIGRLGRWGVPGKLKETLSGEIRHESVHAKKFFDLFPEGAWSRLSGHAQALGVMMMDTRDVLRAIGDKYYHVFPQGEQLWQTYARLYEANGLTTSQMRRLLDEEGVAHMMELRHRGYLDGADFEPVRDLVDAFDRGEFTNVPLNTLVGRVRGIVKAVGSNGAPRDGKLMAAQRSNLDMSQEARMARARELGFDTDTVLYHGSQADIKEFDLTKSENTWRGNAIHLTDAPKVAEMYGGDAHSPGAIYPLYMRGKVIDYINSTLPESLLSPNDLAKINDKFGELKPGQLTPELVANAVGHNRMFEIAKADGFDGVRDGGHYMMFDPRNIRSVNAAFDPAEEGSANLLAALRGQSDRDVDALGYYSKALEAARNWNQAKGTPEQALKWLENSGVKKTEIEATKLNDYFAQRQREFDQGDKRLNQPIPRDAQGGYAAVQLTPEESTSLKNQLQGVATFKPKQLLVTRDDLVKHLEDNQVRLNESKYGTPELQPGTMVLTADEWAKRTGSDASKLPLKFYAIDADGKAVGGGRTYENAANLVLANRPKFASYSLDPNNPTYRETVLHLPSVKERFNPNNPAHRAAAAVNRYLGQPDLAAKALRSDIEQFPLDPDTVAKRETLAVIESGNIPFYRQDGFVTAAKDGLDNFESGHFPEPNITGHMMTSMTKHEGKPVFTLDQIQSDWGQRLREGGVRDEAKIAELRERSDKETSKLEALREEYRNIPLNEKYEPAEYGYLEQQPFFPDAPGGGVRLSKKAKAVDDRIASQINKVDLIDAELETAEAAIGSGNPLVNTTDQWTTTTLRRALKQAVDDGAEYIAIPKGDTVLSYNPGDKNGMNVFYNDIVPKNARKILEKMDKEAAKPVSVDKLETPTKGMAGQGFTLFPITDKVRAAVNEGQPLFAIRSRPPGFLQPSRFYMNDQLQPDAVDLYNELLNQTAKFGRFPTLDEILDAVPDIAGIRSVDDLAKILKAQGFDQIPDDANVLEALQSTFERMMDDINARREQLDRTGMIPPSVEGGMSGRPPGMGEPPQPSAAGAPKPKGPAQQIADMKARIAELEEFTGLDEQGLGEIADQTINKVIGTPAGRLPESEDGVPADLRNLYAKYGMAGPLHARTIDMPDNFRMISKDGREIKFTDFLDDDIERIGKYFARSMIPDVEITREFGDLAMSEDIRKIKDESTAKFEENLARARAGEMPLEQAQKLNETVKKQRDAALRDLEVMNLRLRGRFNPGGDLNATAHRFARTAKQVNLLRLLGGMTVSAIPDMARSVMTQGLLDSFDGLGTLLTNFKAAKLTRDEVATMASIFETTLDTRTLSMADMLDDFGGHSRMDRALDMATSNFGMVSLMAPWNQALKEFVGMVAQKKIIKAGNQLLNGYTLKPAEIKKLAAAGFDQDMLTRVAEQFRRHGDINGGAYLANIEKWYQPRHMGGDPEAATALKAALNREVNRTIVTIGQDRPILSSKPLGGLALQFKSFAIASVQKTIMAGLQERDAGVLIGALFAVTLGGLVEVMKGWLNNVPSADTPQKILYNAFDRSGLNGYLADINHAVETISLGTMGVSGFTGEKLSRYKSRNATDAFLGPTAGLIHDAIASTGSAVASASGKPDAFNANSLRAFRRMVPYQNLFYLSRPLRELENALVDDLGLKDTRKRRTN